MRPRLQPDQWGMVIMHTAAAAIEDNEQYPDAVSNFSKAFADNSSTIQNLTEANNTMVSNLLQLQE